MLLKDTSLRGPKALNATNITKIANIVLKNQMQNSQNNQYRDSCVRKCKLEKQSRNDWGCSYRYADSHLYCSFFSAEKFFQRFSFKFYFWNIAKLLASQFSQFNEFYWKPVKMKGIGVIATFNPWFVVKRRILS